MPIYEYECNKCDYSTEIIQKVSDKPLTKCPQCSDGLLQKKTSLTAFHLKGDGWYKDHYGVKKNTKKAETTTTESKTVKSTTTENKSTS